MQKDNMKRIVGGLHTDNSPLEQPENTTRFVLNGVNETDMGDMNFISNEESNESCFSLPTDYIPLGKVYIGDGEVAIWSVSPTGRSEIGVVDDNCNYTTHVNGFLGFKAENQVDATYRLIRGCNKTVYWVDGNNNPPMTYDFNDPEKYKTNGFWDKKKFYLETSFDIYPEFLNVEVLGGLGQLEAGSYNFGIQYIDENLNPTNVITTSQTVNIYNSNIKSPDFLDVEGSINSDEEAFDFPATDKAVKVNVKVDESFPYYRIVIIEYNLGTGIIASVKYSDIISSGIKTYTYTGQNYYSEGVEEDLKFGGKQIASGESIEQIDNRLVIANTRGQTGDMCALQRFATKINADLVVKKVSGNSVSPGNTKSPTNHFEAVGYMPGEIYSFGLVLVFEDNTESPVYHIPGKNPKYGNKVFEPGDNIYPMSTDNLSDSAVYINNKTCSVDDFWGVDSNDDLIVNTPIRHHRFPYRSDIGVPMVNKEDSDTTTESVVKIRLTSEGDIDTPCTQEEVDNGDCSPLTVADPFQVRVVVTVDGQTDYFYVDIVPEDYKTTTGTATVSIVDISDQFSDDVVIDSIEEEDGAGGWTTITTGSTSPKGLVYTAELTTETYSKTKNDYEVFVYGIKFSNIDLAGINSVSDKKVIGYHIVRNERTEDDRCILDSAIITPTVNSNNAGRYLWGVDGKDNLGESPKTFNSANLKPNYLASGLLSPVFNRNNIQPTYNSGPLNIGSTTNFLDSNKRVSKEFFGLINPEFRFNNKRFENYSRLRQEGTFNVTKRRYDGFSYKDIQEGSSYDPNVHKKKFDDDDGFMFRGGTRDSELDFTLDNDGRFNLDKDDIKETVYVGALGSKDFEGPWKFRNTSADNSIGIVRLNEPHEGNSILNEFPYVYIERGILNPYENFRSLPYYKVSKNLEVTSSTEIFDGDVYITPVRYFSTVKIEDQPAFRVNKNDLWKIVVGAIITVAALVVYVVGSILSLGTLTTLGPLFIGAAGFGVSMIKNGIESQNVIKAYEEEYQDGLKECLIDADTFNGFKYYPSHDDENQWFGEVLTDLWFESPVNCSLRHDSRESAKFFMSAPGIVEGSSLLSPGTRHKVAWGLGKKVTLLHKQTQTPKTKVGRYFESKMLQEDENRKDNKTTIGFPLGELYVLNPDFDRMNKQKVFFHLGVEYDCCADCQEEFPHRVWYSEQSFQEELTDNYRVFQPLNYRDIHGETGKITDLFVMMNNLYIHTEEALWHLPQSHQERVTDQLVTYIGTGDFFSIPPRKVLDDEQQSGGTQHKWATIKAGGHGVFFINERERKVYQFDGQNLKNITDGNSKWFLENIGLKIARDYKYPNNPSYFIGVGFISIYDPEKERVIFTKKDFKLKEGTDVSYNPDIGFYKGDALCNEGFTYDPVKQVCFREEVVEKQPVGGSISVVSAGGDPHGWAEACLYSEYNPDGTGNVDINSTTGYTFEYLPNDWWTGGPGKPASQRYVNLLAKWVSPAVENKWYGGSKIVDVPFTRVYYVALAADDEFRLSVDGIVKIKASRSAMNAQQGVGVGSPFKRIHIYPIELEAGCRLIKVEGIDYSDPGLFAAAILDNTYSEIVGSTSQGDLNEIYSTQHVTELFADGFTQGCPPDSVPLGNGLCDGCLSRTEEPLLVELVSLENEEYFNNKSWTMSYALPNPQRKGNIWVSWHSFLPRFYLRNKNKFYSWVSGNDYFWRHNVLGNYQTYYGKYNPHIVEYVSNSNPVETRIWEDITLNTEAKRYEIAEEFYVDERFITFNKMIAYNTRQNTGLLNLKVKENEDANYLSYQVEDNTPGTIKIDRDERTWHVNDLRDIRIDYTIPMFRKDGDSLSTDYYIDKVLNTPSLDVNKEWFELESLRDKYLVIRLIFDNFDNIRLITNFTSETETQSFR